MPSAATFTQLVADLFRAHPNEWIDGRELAKVGGCYRLEEPSG